MAWIFAGSRSKRSGLKRMEYALRLTSADEPPNDARAACSPSWRTLLPDGPTVALYFGSEFCEDRLPDVIEAIAFCDLACEHGWEPTLVTPLVTPEGLRTVDRLLGALAVNRREVSVVFNDWGVLGLLRTRHASVARRAGRLVNRSLRDPRAYRDAPAGTATHDAARYTRLRRFLGGLGVTAIESDADLEGGYLGGGLDDDGAGLDRALHLPFTFAASGRGCPLKAALYPEGGGFTEAFGSASVHRRSAKSSGVPSLDDLRRIVALADRRPVFVTLNAPSYPAGAVPRLAEFGRMLIDDVGAAALYRDLGVSRVILPRHMTLREIEQTATAGIQCEVFALNDGCAFEEGICATTHAFRPYCIDDRIGRASRRLDERYEFWKWTLNNCGCQTSRGYTLGPCGLCALPRLGRIGIASLKVVGREASLARKTASVRLAAIALDLAQRGAGPEDIRAAVVTERGAPELCENAHLCYYPDVWTKRVDESRIAPVRSMRASPAAHACARRSIPSESC